MLILLIGAGTSSAYQIMAMEDQLDEITRAVDHLDDKIKLALYEKEKFYRIATDVLRLAPTDPNASQVADEFKLRQLQAAQPALMDVNAPTTPAAPIAAPTPSAATNSVPTEPSPATNTEAVHPPSPATR